jgi:Glycosyltransferase sugar-binding region containing DXD motif
LKKSKENSMAINSDRKLTGTSMMSSFPTLSECDLSNGIRKPGKITTTTLSLVILFIVSTITNTDTKLRSNEGSHPEAYHSQVTFSEGFHRNNSIVNLNEAPTVLPANKSIWHSDRATTQLTCSKILEKSEQLSLSNSDGVVTANRMINWLEYKAFQYRGETSENMTHLTTNTVPFDSTVNFTELPPQLVHFYSNRISEDLSFAVASALAVKEDWSQFQILVWLPLELFDSWIPPPNWPKCPRQIQVLPFNVTREAENTPLQSRIQEGLPGKLASDISYTTDAYRLILLYKYGGMWVDVDSLFVSDYDALFRMEFAGYRYGAFMNGAVMRFQRGSEAIVKITEEAAKWNRYGPFDGFSGLKPKFWKAFNQERDQVNMVCVLPKASFELPECNEDCGLRKGCRFYSDLLQANLTSPQTWYDSEYFGINDQQHIILHTHNECKLEDRVYHENSPFGILLRLYLKIIQNHPACNS